MDSKSQTRKLILFLFVIGLNVSIVNAASLSLQDDTVWVNGENNRLEATVSGSDAANLTIQRQSSNTETTIFHGSGRINTSQFSSFSQDGKYKLKLYNNTSNSPVQTEEIFLKKFVVNIENDGAGFIDKKLGKAPNTDPMSLTLRVESQQRETVDKSDITRSNFLIPSEEAEFNDQDDVDAVQEDKKAAVTLYPFINEWHPQDEKLRLRVTYNHEGSEVIVEKKFNPLVHSMQAVPVGETPSFLMDYAEISKFSYKVDIFEKGKDTSPKVYDRFDLKIVNLGNGNEFKPDGGSTQWLDVQAVDSGEADYSLTLKSIPQLDTGTYKFITRLKDPETEEYTVIDTIRVRNGLKLAGRVVDSGNRGVRTEMTLKRSGTVIPINTGSDGSYYKEIQVAEGKNKYDSVVMNFFDTAKSAADARITVNQIDFEAGRGEKFAGDSESIKFEYWQNPQIEKKAIEPINMMAVKFAYPIAESGHKASMKFNPENVDFEELKVFRCSNWNFKGATCFGEWKKVDEDVTINYRGSRINFPIDHPYNATNAEGSDKNILMNAYIVGTSADLRINNRPSVTGTTGGKVETGGEITVSGRIISENENFVEGANVTVEFWEGNSKVDSLDIAQTDVTGQFSASGKAPGEPGNYSLVVKADKERYNSFEKKYRNRFEVFIKEGIGIEAESPLEVPMGKNKTTEITVENIGQTEMKNVELRFEGLNSAFYSISKTDLGSIKAGEKKVTALTFKLPSTYCGDSSCTYPTVDIAASAENSEGDVFEDSKGIQTQLTDRYEGSDQKSGNEDNTKSGQSSSSQESNDNSGSGFDVPTDEIERATGEFITAQSSLNIALGLIMVFMMVMAGAIKKQKNSSGSGRRTSRGSGEPSRGERPRVQKPSVGGESAVKQVEPRDEEDEKYRDNDQVESHVDAIADSIASEDESGETKQKEEVEEESTPVETSEESGQSGDKEKYVCEETGEEFDTKAALEMHKKMNGIE